MKGATYRTIVYICDATGNCMQVFAAKSKELN